MIRREVLLDPESLHRFLATEWQEFTQARCFRREFQSEARSLFAGWN